MIELEPNHFGIAQQLLGSKENKLIHSRDLFQAESVHCTCKRKWNLDHELALNEKLQIERY